MYGRGLGHHPYKSTERRQTLLINIGNNTGNSGGLQDTRIDTEQSGTYNYGAHVKGYCGSNGAGREMRELHRWNLSSIPAGASCDAAALYLYDTNWANRTANLTITLYQIAAANADWVEGTKGAPLSNTEVGSACWAKRVYNTVNWAGSAGLSTAGTDYVNTTLGSASFTDGVSGYRTITINAAGLAVLASLFGATDTRGFILIGTGAGAVWTEFESSAGADTHRPYLAITYTAAGSAVAPILSSQYRRRWS